MKLKSQELKRGLANGKPTYKALLFYGPDHGLVRELAHEVVSAYAGNSQDDMLIVRLATDQVKSEPSHLFEELSNMLLTGEQPVVWLEHATNTLAKTVQEALEDVSCVNPLVITAGELDTKSSLRKYFESGKEVGAVACYREEGATLKNSIQQFLRDHQIQATPDALAILTASLGNDHGITRQELEKIALYLGEDKQLDADAVQILIGQNDDKGLDDICSAIAEGQAHKVNTLIERLSQEGTNSIAMIRSALRYFDRLLLVRLHMQEGSSADQAVGSLRPPVFFRQKPLLTRQAQRLSAPIISRVLSLLLQAERDTKQGKEALGTAMTYLTLASRLCMPRR